jgi:hypothetical protein
MVLMFVSTMEGFFMSVGKMPPSTNTGDYCAARAKLNVEAIRELLSLVDRNHFVSLRKNGLGKVGTQS